MLNLSFGEECYGPVIQGEGLLAGTPSVFIRTSGCNLSCVWKSFDNTLSKCDTPHTSIDLEKPSKVSLEDLVDRVKEKKCDHVVISGGEPYMQRELPNLVSLLSDSGYHVTIETNGTIYKETRANLISISPKLSSSSHHQKRGIKHEKIRLNLGALINFINYSNRVQLKFVISSENDEIEIKKILDYIEEHNNLTPIIGNYVYVMPQGTTNEELNKSAKIAIPMAIKNSWKYTDRLHIRLFGNIRGI